MIVRNTNDIGVLDEIMSVLEALEEDAGTDNIMDILDSLEFEGSERDFFNLLEDKQVITGKFLDSYEEIIGDISYTNSIHVESLHEFIANERVKLDADKVIEYIVAKYMEQTEDGINSLFRLLTESYIWDEYNDSSIEIEVTEHQEYKYLE